MKITRLSDNPILRGLTRKCWPKEQHKSPRAAEAQLASLVRRGLLKNGTARVYHCTCGFYHVGHALKEVGDGERTEAR